MDLESHPNAVVCSKCVLDPIYHGVLSWSLASTYRLSLHHLACRVRSDVPGLLIAVRITLESMVTMVVRKFHVLMMFLEIIVELQCCLAGRDNSFLMLSKDLGLSRKLMGILLVLMPTMSFLGGLFWSVIVDRTGSYRGVLTTTSLLGVTTIFGYLLPQAATSFSAVWWYGDGSIAIIVICCMNLFWGIIVIWVCLEMRYIPPIIDNYCIS